MKGTRPLRACLWLAHGSGERQPDRPQQKTAQVQPQMPCMPRMGVPCRGARRLEPKLCIGWRRIRAEGVEFAAGPKADDLRRIDHSSLSRKVPLAGISWRSRTMNPLWGRRQQKSPDKPDTARHPAKVALSPPFAKGTFAIRARTAPRSYSVVGASDSRPGDYPEMAIRCVGVASERRRPTFLRTTDAGGSLDDGAPLGGSGSPTRAPVRRSCRTAGMRHTPSRCRRGCERPTAGQAGRTSGCPVSGRA